MSFRTAKKNRAAKRERAAGAGKNAALSKNARIDHCDALYIWHKDPVYRMALRAVGGDREWALALLESCMARATRYLDKFDADARSERSRSIITAIFQSEINEIYERAWRGIGLSDGYKNPRETKKDKFDVNQILIRNELSAGLAQYVERLTRKEKELVFFRYFVGLTEEELRARFQCEAEELRGRLFLIKQKLSKMIVEGQLDAQTLEDHLVEGQSLEDHYIEGQIHLEDHLTEGREETR